MKKRKLCYECPISKHCESYCEESAETQDREGYYMEGKYKPKGIPLISYEESRHIKSHPLGVGMNNG